MPYRTLENVIDGVVMTFSDITKAKKLEAELRLAHEESEARLEKNKPKRRKIKNKHRVRFQANRALLKIGGETMKKRQG